MSGRLAGRTALVTGATRGIGRGIAEGFAREGADLLLAATSEEGLKQVATPLRSYGARVETAAVDVSNRRACFELVRHAVAAFGRLDVLVNNAGIYIARGFLDYSYEEFERIQQVNLHSVFHVMQAALPHMIDNGYGKIINVVSTAGKWASRNQSAYNVAKHGVVGLTRCVALEMAANGIGVNAICPGLVETDLLDGFLDAHAELNGSDRSAVREGLLARVPQGRFLNVADCAHLAVYLAAGESDGMTGQSLLLDGGMLVI
jgi:3-hydroxybutyrate dehydrogenase